MKQITILRPKPMRESEVLHQQPILSKLTNPRRLWLLGIIAYLVLYALSWLAFQQPTPALILLPVLLTGWLGGWRLGLLAGLVALPANLLLAALFGAGTSISSNDGWFYVGAMLAGISAGQWRAAQVANSRQQAAQLQAAAQWHQEKLAHERALAELQGESEALKAELRAAETELATQKVVMTSRSEDAQAADRLKTELLANVGHELRSPLGAIIGFAEMLHAGYYDTVTSRQQHILQRIIRKAHDMTTLVNDLLDQAQLETGKLSLSNTPFSPAHLLAGVDDLLGLKAKEKGVALDGSVATDMPPMLIGDPMRLQQILVNLVDNAIKFTPSGGVVTVAVSKQEAGDQTQSVNGSETSYWLLSVTDTGCGIEAADHARVFEAFRQGRRARADEKPGFGLGLSIVKQLTEIMGGEVGVRSQPGEGSTFTIRLPLTQAPVQLV